MGEISQVTRSWPEHLLMPYSTLRDLFQLFGDVSLFSRGWLFHLHGARQPTNVPHFRSLSNCLARLFDDEDPRFLSIAW